MACPDCRMHTFLWPHSLQEAERIPPIGCIH
jgi:hypothetical protein